MKPSLGVALLSLGLLPGMASADEPPKPPPIWSGKAEASYVATTGNSDSKTAGAAGEVVYAPGLWNYKASFAYIRSEADDVETAKSFRGLLRAARKLSPRLEIFGQGTYFENQFAGIDHQWAGEAGAAYQFLSGDPQSLKVETGFGYLTEKRLLPRVSPGPQLTETRDFATARLGLEYKWKFSKTGELSDEAFFLADLSDSDDWRYGNKISLGAGLTTVLSVKLSYAWLTLNQPVPGKKKTDTITSAALVAKF